MAHRYFTTEIKNAKAILTNEDSQHLKKVLRSKIGDTVFLCDGKGMDYEAQISRLDEGAVVCDIIATNATIVEPNICVCAYVGYSKGDRLEWAIQKLVELGVAEIIPFFSENCVVKPKKEEEKNKRYNKIALEAAKQSGRGILPKVHMPLQYKPMLAQAVQQQKALFLYEHGGEKMASVIDESTNFAIITGAEGGFTQEEAKMAIEHGCVPIGLGPRILRCETAPVAAIAALMTLTGNLE